MRTFHLVALLLLFLPINLNASPDFGLYENERSSFQDVYMPATAILCDDDFASGSGTLTPAQYLITNSDAGFLAIGHSTRSSRWWLTDAWLRQLLAPIPI